MNITINIELDSTDEATYIAASPADQDAFVAAKYAALKSGSLQSALANSDILGMLQPADQTALEALIAAVQAMPKVGG